MIVFAVLCAVGAGALVGVVVGLFSGVFLAVARDRLLGRDPTARQLAFATSASPFLALAVTWPSARTVLAILALASGLAGASLARLCLYGYDLRP